MKMRQKSGLFLLTHAKVPGTFAESSWGGEEMEKGIWRTWRWTTLTPLVICLGLIFMPVPAQAADISKKQAEIRKRIEAKKQELNGGEWQVTIKSSSGKQALDGPDVLTFQDNLFRSKASSKLGFTPTNYTLTVSESEEGPTVWETMQTSSKGEVMFWRGEWSEQSMTGSINRQMEEGKVEEYSFTSSSMVEIPESSTSEDTDQGLETGKPADEGAVKETLKSDETSDLKKKKKKGWF
ncbi:MAG: hypothetical protein A3D87_01755 [Omnitrophica WOR_2 bacterium RIFCSPHIGHO2_02_FULL_50_17]|nr:MAG: hypothetical protein A3D87_01755 [Omnitrophica WOR_2 bacterium RIFCSPHIGHO2_02_FULL_50_17]